MKEFIYETPEIDIFLHKEEKTIFYQLSYKDDISPSVRDASFGRLLAKAGCDSNLASKIMKDVFGNINSMKDFKSYNKNQ